MNTFVDREFEPVRPILTSGRTTGFFGIMLVISLALHVISSVILLSPRQSALHAPSITYLDLKNIQLQEQQFPPAARQTESAAPLPAENREAEPPPPAPRPETEKLYEDVKQSLADAGARPEVLHERSLGLGLTNGYFSSIAEGESLRNDIRDYYFSMLREINEKWWLTNDGSFAGLRGAIVEIVVAKNGMIVNKTLVRSSGNRSFDQAIFQTLDKANPLPPLPHNYALNYFRAPLRFVAPLNLLAS